MAAKCKTCGKVYSSKLDGCPNGCVEVVATTQDKEEIKDTSTTFAPNKKSVRRPLRRGKFTR